MISQGGGARSSSIAIAAENSFDADGARNAAFTPTPTTVGSNDGTDHWANATASLKVVVPLEVGDLPEVIALKVALPRTNRRESSTR